MLDRLRRAGRSVFVPIEGGFDRVFSPRHNPFYQLGAMSYFFYWIVAATGIYLFFGFKTSVSGAYDSVQYLTNQQWYLGGVLRSFHRYASDAMVVTAMLHLVREFSYDRYRGVRFFTWITGVPILWLLFASGITGYWLVWDKLSQYIAVMTTEWLDWLPIFGEPIARNFLTPGSLGDRFFTLLVFLHIAVPLFLLLAMWVHIFRLSQPKVNPPRVLAAGTMVMLLVLALVDPATSRPPADLATVPTVINLDWFYLGLYPLFDLWSYGTMWLVAGGATLILAALPWLPPRRRAAVALVDLDNCNGCARCFADCPFAAVTMRPRTDGGPYEQEATVDPNLCVSCGICVGACPASTPFRKAVDLVTGIDLPDFRLHDLRAATEAGLKRMAVARVKNQAEGAGKSPATMVVYGCDHGPDVTTLESDTVAAFSLPCIGFLPPAFIDFVLSRGGADGVMLTGCREEECYYRFGVRWTTERVAGIRDPYLRARVPRDRIGTFWGAAGKTAALDREVKAFGARLGAPGGALDGGIDTTPPCRSDADADGAAPDSEVETNG